MKVITYFIFLCFSTATLGASTSVLLLDLNAYNKKISAIRERIRKECTNSHTVSVVDIIGKREIISLRRQVDQAKAMLIKLSAELKACQETVTPHWVIPGIIGERRTTRPSSHTARRPTRPTRRTRIPPSTTVSGGGGDWVIPGVFTRPGRTTRRITTPPTTVITTTAAKLTKRPHLGNETDPCDDPNIMNLGEKWRIDRMGSAIKAPYCDRERMVKAGKPWFRFSGKAGGQLLTRTCPPILSCGARAPIWTDYRMPRADQVKETFTIYAYANKDGQCLSGKFPLRVRRCSASERAAFIYQLVTDEVDCSTAFCGTGYDYGF